MTATYFGTAPTAAKNAALAEAARAFTAENKRRGVAIIVSDLYDPAGFERGIDVLRFHRFEPFVIQVVDREEIVPDVVGDVRVLDMVIQGALDLTVGNTRVRVEPQAQTVERDISQGVQFGRLVGTSTAMREVFAVLERIATAPATRTAREIDELFADGTISGGMLPKISSALDAAKSGVNSVHIVDGRIEHSLLLEILTEQAFGTMIRSH